MVRKYIGWLLIPIVLLLAAMVYTIFRNDTGSVNNRPLHRIGMPADKKLHRTLSYWNKGPQSSTLPKNIGFPGLKFELFIKDSEWSALLKRENVNHFKENRRDLTIRINEDFTRDASYRIRGGGSITKAYKDGKPERLNYHITLFRPLCLAPGIKMKKLFLVSMIADPYYYETEFSHRILRKLGLFPAYTQFISMNINGIPLGLYLLVERPKDAIRRSNKNVTGIYRRNRDYRQPDQLYFDTKFEQPATGQKHIHQLYETIERLKGKRLVAALDNIINLDAYFTWLAFNSLVFNQDTFDEIFFYVLKSNRYPEGRIEMMAWDYDDIMKPSPGHPEIALKDPLLFSCEGELDRVIQSEPLLYARFVNVFHKLLSDILTESELNAMITSVYNEVQHMETGLPEPREKVLKAERTDKIHVFKKFLFERRAGLMTILKEMVASDAG